MNKQILKYTSAVALLLNSSSASQLNTSAPKVANNPNGNGGPAPCLDQYIMGGSGDLLGEDTHSAHGLQAADGSLVSVGGGGANKWIYTPVVPGNRDDPKNWEFKKIGYKAWIMK